MPEFPAPRRHFRETFAFKLALSLALVCGIAIVVSRLHFRHDLGFLNVALVSGSPEGHYHLIGQQMSEYVASQHGHLSNVATEGTVDNLHRLAGSSHACAVQFGLVQDGAEWPADGSVELVGRLPRAEGVLLLGRRADEITTLSQLAHLRIGAGPAESGSARVAHQIFDSPDFRSLGVQLSHHELNAQLELAAKGELDLALSVMDEDAPLIRAAVRDHGLEVVGLPQAAVMARQAAHLRTGVLPAGLFDPVRLLPPTDKTILEVETLVVSNGCGSRSQTIGLMEALSQVYPDFVRHNRETANTTGLRLSPAAKSYLDNEGPEVFDQYAPWLVDVMPPGNWVYIVTAVSVLFNVMGFGHRYRLWQIDARRVKLEQELFTHFAAGTTLGDIEHLEPGVEHRSAQDLQGLDGVVQRFERLAARSRRDSLSILVPMGQEMGYRYQENLIHQTLAVVRDYLRRARPV